MSRNLKTGIVWLRFMGRIADVRAERHKVPKPKSRPMPSPIDTFPEAEAVGNAPEVAELP